MVRWPEVGLSGWRHSPELRRMREFLGGPLGPGLTPVRCREVLETGFPRRCTHRRSAPRQRLPPHGSWLPVGSGAPENEHGRIRPRRSPHPGDSGDQGGRCTAGRSRASGDAAVLMGKIRDHSIGVYLTVWISHPHLYGHTSWLWRGVTRPQLGAPQEKGGSNPPGARRECFT
jgi:hypothetical protein